MTKHEQVANIISFFCIVFGEDSNAFNAVLKLSPDYLIEKFNRYIDSLTIEYPWGMHPGLRNQHFQKYVDKWKLELKDE